MGSLFGHEIRSSIPLSRLRPGRGERGEIAVSEGDESILDTAGEVTMLQPGDDATVAEPFAIATVGGGHLVVCGITGGYLLDPQRLTITVVRRGAATAWEHRLATVVLPLLLSARGDLVLHAAVVESDGGALILCGPTMGGKSTLAKAYAQLGRRVLSEDGAVVGPRDGTIFAWPGATGVRIRERGPAGPSRRVEPLPHADVPPLQPAAIVLLSERGPELVVEPLERAEALMRLSPHLLHTGGQQALGIAFGALASLLGSVPALAASLPDDLGRLPAAAAEMESLAMGKIESAAR